MPEMTMRHWKVGPLGCTEERTVASKPSRMSSRPVNSALDDRVTTQCTFPRSKLEASLISLSQTAELSDE